MFDNHNQIRKFYGKAIVWHSFQIKFLSEKLIGSQRSSTLSLLMSSSIVSILGPFFLLLMTATLAHRLGPAEYGSFSFGLGIATILAPIAGLGLPTASQHFIPSYIATGKLSLLRGYLSRSTLVVSCGAALFVILIFLINVVFRIDAAWSTSLFLAAILVPVMAFRLLRRSQLVAVGQSAKGVLWDEVFPPFAVIFVLYFLHLTTGVDIALVMAATSIVCVVLAAHQFRNALPAEIQKVPPTFLPLSVWLSTSVPLMLGFASNMIRLRMDVVMLAPMSSLEQVGIFGAAFRLSYVLLLPALVVSMVFTPLLSSSHSILDHNTLRRRFLTMCVLVLSAVAFIGPCVLYFSGFLVSHILGRSFLVAIPTFQVLCIAQMVAGLTVPLSALMLATNRVKAIAAINFAGLIVCAASNLVLIPQMEARGVAYALLATSSLIFVLQLYVCQGKIRAMLGGINGQYEGGK